MSDDRGPASPSQRRRHDARARRLQDALARSPGPVALHKQTSNLFRHRARRARSVDIRAFDQVLGVGRGKLEVQGMAPYERIVRATLAQGCMPAVVPQLKSITVGGAAAGIGIEASSFRYGFVHETVEAFDVLTGSGEVVHCRPDNEHRELFFAFPNSYGTLGYALRLVLPTIPVLPFVRLEHLRFAEPGAYFEALALACARPELDFVDGSIFAARHLVLSVGRFVASARHTRNYQRGEIYHRAVAERRTDVLKVADYLWRWDTDWFWCSRHFGAENRWLRLLAGRRLLRSTTYWKIRHWYGTSSAVARLERWLRRPPLEPVVQDVEIPVGRAAAFLEFFQREIGILPVWVCPIRPRDPAVRWTLYPVQPELYVNFGFWDLVPARDGDPWHHNRRIEAVVAELGGRKSLYSKVCYERQRFWEIYDRSLFKRLKARYDAHGRLPDLFEKVTGRAQRRVGAKQEGADSLNASMSIGG